jgi:hypothetical protein
MHASDDSQLVEVVIGPIVALPYEDEPFTIKRGQKLIE